MDYILQHKNDIVAYFTLQNDKKYFADIKVVNSELLPLPALTDKVKLNDWWQQRAVPSSQDGIRVILDSVNAGSEYEFLADNYGLSLNDCYWIQPVNEDNTWESVNLFSNNFQSYVVEQPDNKAQTPFVPASSTIGELRKRWIIIDGDRYLIKGNATDYSQQSLNEVFISDFHKKQASFDYVTYEPVALSALGDGLDGVGCMSMNFASEDVEFIPAIQVVHSKKKNNQVSWFEHYINICVENGIEEQTIRSMMDYMITSDFLLTQTDRHFNNFGILRDANTLKFIAPAPIFDNGNSMFFRNSVLPDLYNIEIKSFASTELKQLKYVTDRKLVKLDYLPSISDLEAIYSKDNSPVNYLPIIEEGFKQKRDMLYEFSLGKELTPHTNFYVHKETEVDEQIKDVAKRLKKQ